MMNRIRLMGIIFLSSILIIIELLFISWDWLSVFIPDTLFMVSFGGGAMLKLPILMNATADSYIVAYFLSLGCAVLLIICGFGMLMLKNFARTIVVWIASINILLCLNNIFYLWVFTSQLRNMKGFLIGAEPVLFALVYIIFFTHPKVRALFK